MEVNALIAEEGNAGIPSKFYKAGSVLGVMGETGDSTLSHQGAHPPELTPQPSQSSPV